MLTSGPAVSAEVSRGTAEGEHDYWAKEHHVRVDCGKCSYSSDPGTSSRTCCFQGTEGGPCNSTRRAIMVNDDRTISNFKAFIKVGFNRFSHKHIWLLELIKIWR